MSTLEEIKARQQVAWSSGDYSKIAWITHPLGDILCEAVDLRAGSTVLDVATGTGHVALAAARRFCEVCGIDYVPGLLEHARRRASAEGLRIDFREGDAESIPVPDDSFDYVLSTIGAMFAPNQEKTAAELARVCRPGGTIGMVNWVPDGFAGELFKLIARHVPPPPELKPAALWGSEERVRELFGDRVSSLAFKNGSLAQRYPSAEFYADFFLTNYGPTLKAVETLDNGKRRAFRHELTDLALRFNRAPDDTLIYESAYLVVLATKR